MEKEIQKFVSEEDKIAFVIEKNPGSPTHYYLSDKKTGELYEVEVHSHWSFSTPDLHKESFDVKDVRNDISYVAHRVNDVIMLSSSCGIYLLKKDKSKVVVTFIDHKNLLPDNVYTVDYVMYSVRNFHLKFVLLHRKYTRAYDDVNNCMFIRIEPCGTYTIYDIKEHDVYRDGGTTDMVLVDQFDYSDHKFHKDSPFCSKLCRQDHFDDVSLREYNPIEDELLEYINSTLKSMNIVVEK